MWAAGLGLRCQIWQPCDEGWSCQQRAASATSGASPGAQMQPGWLMQEQGTLALCPGCCWVSFLPEWQWLQAAVLITSEGGWNLGGITATPSLFWTLCPFGVYCWLSTLMACFLQQQLPVSSKQVEIKTLNTVCLYRPLKENSNQNQFIFLGWISELILRGYNVLVSPKSHLNGWIKHNKTTANKKPTNCLSVNLWSFLLFPYQ